MRSGIVTGVQVMHELDIKDIAHLYACSQFTKQRLVKNHVEDEMQYQIIQTHNPISDRKLKIPNSTADKTHFLIKDSIPDSQC